MKCIKFKCYFGNEIIDLTSFRMPKLALGSKSALLSVGTSLSICAVDTRLNSKEVIQTGPVLTERVLNRHECVVNEGVHQHSLFNYLLKVFTVVQVLLEIIIGNNHTTLKIIKIYIYN